MILIAGSSGFLGQHLCAHLCREGYKVLGLYHNTEPKYSHPNIQYMPLDLMDMYALEELLQQHRPRYLIDAAARVSYGSGGRDIIDYNVQLTENITLATTKLNIPLLKLSSIAALGSEEQDSLIHEESEWNPKVWHSSYSISKKESEMIVWRSIAEGLDAMILCPGIILGRGNPQSISDQFTRNILQENKFYTHGRTLFVDVLDVCRMITHCLEEWKSGEKYIAGYQNLDFHTLMMKVDEAKGIQSAKTNIPKWLARPFLMLYNLRKKMQGKKSMLNAETLRLLYTVSFYSCTKFRQDYPDFDYTDIVDTLRRCSQERAESPSPLARPLGQ